MEQVYPDPWAPALAHLRACGQHRGDRCLAAYPMPPHINPHSGCGLVHDGSRKACFRQHCCRTPKFRSLPWLVVRKPTDQDQPWSTPIAAGILSTWHTDQV